jgi:hypothetical protein
MILVGGCVQRRLTGPEVVALAQKALREERSSHYVLDIELDTDLIKDQLVIEVWEVPPDRLELRVLDASTIQLTGLAFVTDGMQSISYLPQAREAVIGPADLVKMPAVLASLVSLRRDWVLAIDPSDAHVVARERQRGLVLYRVEAALGPGGTAQLWFDARDWLARQIVYQDEHLGTGTIHIRDLQTSDRAAEIDLTLDLPVDVPTRSVTGEESRIYGYEQAQRAASFRLRVPQVLPLETHFAWAYQSEQSMAFVYEGSSRFQLVQGPAVGFDLMAGGVPILVRGHQGLLFEQDGEDALTLTWREDDLKFTISGALNEQEIRRIAESLD